MCSLDSHPSFLVELWLEHKIFESDRHTMRLQVHSIDPSKSCQELTSFLRSVQLVEAMHHTLVRGTKLILVQRSLQMLVVSDDDFTF